jgi:nucleotide-binding universal stress UspA family protein
MKVAWQMATMFRKILCPIDFSDHSIAALREAVRLARRDDALLYVMHVEFVPLKSPAPLSNYIAVSTEAGELRLKQIVRKYLARVKHEFVVRSGWPTEVIDQAAQEFDADLIVMATHGRTGINRLFLGSVAEHVVRTSVRSVLSFGPGATIGSLKRILCPVDFDQNSISALKFGWRLAREYGTAISLLHVVRRPSEPSEMPVEPPTPEWEQAAQVQLARVSAEIGAKAKCELLVRRGDPASAILEVERELRPDLIVMGTHGRTGLSHMVLGSVAEHMVRASAVPVLTVRGAQLPG